ncbi:MAG: hypothetical protein ABH837_04085, partial [bacterium]
SYQDGLLGPYGSFSSTLSPYKYFADDLSKDANISSLPTTSRGRFSAGKTNSRIYTLQHENSTSWYDDTGAFNYAVVAHWDEPVGFDPDEANAQCPVFLDWDIEITEDFDTQGAGSATITCTIYDWQEDNGEVRVESPALFADSQAYSGSGEHEIVFNVSNERGGAVGDQFVLITAESGEEKNFLLLRNEINVAYAENAGWSYPVPIPFSEIPESPYLNVSGTGELYCAWADEDNTTDVWWSEYNGSNWSQIPIDLIAYPDGISAGSPRFLSDSSGWIHLVWDEKPPDEEIRNVYYKHFDPDPVLPDTPFDTAEIVSTGTGNGGAALGAFCPDLILSSTDTLSVFWEDLTPSDDLYRQIKMRQNQLGWEDEEYVTNSDKRSILPRCSIDASDRWHVVWCDHYFGDPSTNEILYTNSDLHPTSEPLVIASGNNASQPVICVAGNNVWIAWTEVIDNKGSIYYTSFLASPDPSPPEGIRINTPTGSSASKPELVCDGSNIVVFWLDSRDDDSDGRWIYGSVLYGTPAIDSLLKIAGPVEQTDYHATVDPTTGTYHLVWVDGSDSSLKHSHSIP